LKVLLKVALQVRHHVQNSVSQVLVPVPCHPDTALSRRAIGAATQAATHACHQQHVARCAGGKAGVHTFAAVYAVCSRDSGCASQLLHRVEVLFLGGTSSTSQRALHGAVWCSWCEKRKLHLLRHDSALRDEPKQPSGDRELGTVQQLGGALAVHAENRIRCGRCAYASLRLYEVRPSKSAARSKLGHADFHLP